MSEMTEDVEQARDYLTRFMREQWPSTSPAGTLLGLSEQICDGIYQRLASLQDDHSRNVQDYASLRDKHAQDIASLEARLSQIRDVTRDLLALKRSRDAWRLAAWVLLAANLFLLALK